VAHAISFLQQQGIIKMTDQTKFSGDAEYKINCTDAREGDHVRFTRAKFAFDGEKTTFAGVELVTGEIIATGKMVVIRQANGSILKITPKNLYRNGLWRKERTEGIAAIGVPGAGKTTFIDKVNAAPARRSLSELADEAKGWPEMIHYTLIARNDQIIGRHLPATRAAELMVSQAGDKIELEQTERSDGAKIWRLMIRLAAANILIFTGFYTIAQNERDAWRLLAAEWVRRGRWVGVTIETEEWPDMVLEEPKNLR